MAKWRFQISFRLSLTIGQMQRNRQFHPDTFGGLLWNEEQLLPGTAREFYQQAGLKQNGYFTRKRLCMCICVLQTNTDSGTVILSPRYHTCNRREGGERDGPTVCIYTFCTTISLKNQYLPLRSFKALCDPFDILWPPAHPWSPPIHGSRQKWLGSNHRHPFPAARRTCTLNDQLKQIWHLSTLRSGMRFVFTLFRLAGTLTIFPGWSYQSFPRPAAADAVWHIPRPGTSRLRGCQVPQTRI